MKSTRLDGDATTPEAATISFTSRLMTLTNWGRVIAVVAAIQFVVFGTQNLGTDYFAFLLVVAGLLCLSVNEWAIRMQQRLLLPHLVELLGLTYQQRATPFMKALPRRLLPWFARRRAMHEITGRIGGNEVSFAEIRIRTWGKRSKVLFNGLVLKFQNTVPMPAFFFASDRLTEDHLSSRVKLDVRNLVRVDSANRWTGEGYGVWMSNEGARDIHPALRPVIEALVEPEQAIGSDAQIFSATSNGEVMHIAITYPRKLFRIGGLIATNARIMAGVQRANEDLRIPFLLVEKLLKAEARVLEDYAE
ncbi:hypothetical protein [Loktanella sp. S4079]|uniref:hypothetical protein n=1 Tax=Loktanella sp. S4079 TaxID=579483 RepID=UPI000A6C7D1C|nr:hypothetical protein [Loktanella sp. S4079]